MTDSRNSLIALAGAMLAVVAPLVGQHERPGAKGGQIKAMGAAAGAAVDRASLYAPLIVAGQTLPGELGQSDGYSLNDGRPVALWTYVGRSDEHVRFAAQAAYRSIVVVLEGQADGSELVLYGSDTTSTVPSVELKLPHDGTYDIRVVGTGPQTQGTFTLTATSYGSVSALDWARVYPGDGDPSERYALLVGVGQYPDTANSLGGGPLNDVELMRDLLVTKFQFKPANVVTLRNVEGNREQIIQAFRRHLGQAGPKGVAVFYYSGHGLEMPDNRYIQDPEPTGKDQALAVWGTNGSLYGYILDDEMGILVGDLDAGRVLVILDDCYSGNQTRAGGVAEWGALAAGAPPPTMVRGTAAARVAALSTRGLRWRTVSPRMEEPGGWVHSIKGRQPDVNVESSLTEPANHILLAASADSEESGQGPFKLPDGRIADQGFFTLSLWGELKRAPSTLTFAAALADVKRDVLDFTKSRGTVQTPQVEGKDKFRRIAEFLAKRP